MALAGVPPTNLLLIVSDDQGPWALGCAGNEEIRTPHLDALAASGVRLSHFFCTSPVCSPARASLLTGAIPSQHGVHDWIRGGNVGPDAIRYLEGQTTYVDLLAAAGYTCGLIGKWHLADSATPQHGFSHWFVHQAGSSTYHDAPMTRDGRLFAQPGYLTDVLAADGVAFLQRHAADATPFYLGVHFTAPHSPWVGEHPQELVDSYADTAFESCPQEPPHPWSQPKGPHEQAAQHDPRPALQGYFAAVTAMDAAIGRILAALDTLALRERTLVGFVGDNGFNAGHHGIWGKGNGTFPLNAYEESVRLPAIFAHPGRIPAGRTIDALISGYDLKPTLLDHLGLSDPTAERLPGRSAAALLARSQTGEREHLVVHEEYGPTRMIRTHEWKYVHRYAYGPHELYDLTRDLGERRNLADDPSHANTVRALRAELSAWFHRYVDPALDGSREPVRGHGQRCRLDTDANAGEAQSATEQ